MTWNTGAQRIKGYEADEIIGQHFSKFYPPEALQAGTCRTMSCESPAPRAGSRTRAGEYAKTERGFGRMSSSPLCAMTVGELRGFAKVTRDLTQRREHEESLRQSEERFRLLVEGVTDYAIFMLDPNGYVMTWNSGAQRIKGYQASEIIGQHFSKFYPPDVAESGMARP